MVPYHHTIIGDDASLARSRPSFIRFGLPTSNLSLLHFFSFWRFRHTTTLVVLLVVYHPNRIVLGTTTTTTMTSNKPKSDLPLVPEAVLRKRHDLDELARKRAAAAIPQKKARQLSGKKAFYVKKPETFLARARSRQNHDIRYKRVQKKGMQKRASQTPVMATQEVVVADDNAHTNGLTTTTTKTVEYQANSVGADMVFVIRIRDHGGEPRSVRRALSQLRLRRVHEGVFVRYSDPGVRRLLHLVEPWVVYGTPSPAVVTDLITRRGFGKVNRQRVPLSDNVTIEQALGEEHNIICVEDLVHEIVNVGESFKAATTFLWPFRLTDTKTRFERQVLKLKDGKNYGDKGQAINEYIKQIL